jgi:hypothetical protein
VKDVLKIFDQLEVCENSADVGDFSDGANHLNRTVRLLCCNAKTLKERSGLVDGQSDAAMFSAPTGNPYNKTN